MATTSNVGNSTESTTSVMQATIGWVELLKTARKMEKKYKKQMEELRRQMTRNYRLVTTQIEKENNDHNDHNVHNNDEERAKKWIRENLEDAQQFIDRTVGIKGITEDPLKVVAEIEGCGSSINDINTNVIAANTEGTLQAQFLDNHHDDDDDVLTSCQSSYNHHQALPRVSISSSIVPSSISQEELYGY